MSNPIDSIFTRLRGRMGPTLVAGAPEGFDAMVVGRCAASGADVLHVARDDARLQRIADGLAFFHPSVVVLRFPAWDTLPYDRVSPNPEIMAQRTDTLSRLTQKVDGLFSGRVILTTVSAVLQRVPPRDVFAGSNIIARRGEALSVKAVLEFFTANGYTRTGTVREPGEYAVRGGIVDVFPPGTEMPVRLDFFGDELDQIRLFDPLTQQSAGQADLVQLRPVSEIMLNQQRITRFRESYRATFQGDVTSDPLYESISQGRKFSGMEHWLPLYFDKLETLFDYTPDAMVTLDYQAEVAVRSRLELIEEYYQARKTMLDGGSAEMGGVKYRPVPPRTLFLSRDEWERRLNAGSTGSFSPFAPVELAENVIDAGGRAGPDFSEARARPDANVFDELRQVLQGLKALDRRTVIAAYSPGSRDRLGHVLKEHGIHDFAIVRTWDEARSLGTAATALVELPLERGISTDEFTIITEQDILGDRLIRQQKKRRSKSDAFLTELENLESGDLVVHVDHGIGRYDGLETLEVMQAPHDFLRVLYDGGDKLFVPVENMDVLSRYGSEDVVVQLDKLGSASWQSRKARVKERIGAIAEALMKVAAERQLRQGEVITVPEGLYDEFSARFPYTETDDQQRAIADVITDLASGKPMDRLICGDVGFGKTEVAMRAAFVCAMSGLQVAIVVPTTLLARQHYRTFRERFEGLPLNIGHLSRLTPPKEATDVRNGIETGDINIVVGTHALLGKSIKFKNLGLVIVDEEQHFGVQQKERLKQLRTDVHMLTLTATPIPRTLQMALAGVREMSLIATPPVDRLAVRTFVLPYDPVVIREAIQREVTRGGQVFYVCPRIEDLSRLAERLDKLVPDIKYVTAHGQMAPTLLEDVMTRFYDGGAQVLLSTNIIESGLDMPSVNTIIIHRSDRFGLAQLYQLRGRVGRAKIRAYAYLTLPQDQLLSDTAKKRLEVMQTLDTLGAGFTLASHDLDIRGAGNLLGEEQSGHIKEVGIELYQQMLEEAVAYQRELSAHGGEAAPLDEEWTPSIAIGSSVLIPENYVADLGVRLALYRRIAGLLEMADIDAFAAEMIDRFGKLPREVENLLEIIAIKGLCRQANIEKIDAGPKGAVLSFRNDSFANPDGLIALIAQQAGTLKLRPDHKLVYRREWDGEAERIKGVKSLMQQLARIAMRGGHA
ncbi:MAG: transcription-repair coupling factor [Alphaproteobacteria bacterium]